MDPEYASKRLESIVGAENALRPLEASRFAINGCAPAISAVFPESSQQIQEIVAFCSANHLTISPYGGGTMAGHCSRPASFDVAVVTSRMNQVTDYQPENLVYAAEAGVTGLQTRQTLSTQHQLLPLDPPRFDAATLGGILASRASGPARYEYGTPRDILLGVTVVNAEGQIVKAGGKVVKNVAGYDMCKLYTGSLGTLGIIVECAFKLSPLPEKSIALAAGFDGWDGADKLTAFLMHSFLNPRSIEALNVSAMECLPEKINNPPPVSLMAIFDGTEEQIDFQREEFRTMAEMAGCKDINEYDCNWYCEFHKALMDVATASPEGCVFTANGVSSDVPRISNVGEDAAKRLGLSVRISASTGNGIVRFAADECSAEQYSEMSSILRSTGIRSINCFRLNGASAADVWGEKVQGLELMHGIKSQLDPAGVFSTGRFVGGI